MKKAVLIYGTSATTSVWECENRARWISHGGNRKPDRISPIRLA